MAKFQGLHEYLVDWAAEREERQDVAETILSIAKATARISALIAQGPIAGTFGEIVGDNADGDAQKALDVYANELFIASLENAPVAVVGSEEEEFALVLNETAPLAVAIDPLDGSSNIDTNVSIGTIFSILPASNENEDSPESALLQPGANQLAAGFVIYGPQTALVLTVGEGTQIFTHERKSGRFLLTSATVRIPANQHEYAINASNYRHWDEPVRAYIDDCIAGAEGPQGENFNMRWIASLVAETFRIFARGGIFLYPRDNRAGYQNGRLRLTYEANPIAFLVEQAGGAATDGEHRILDIAPHGLHQRVPLVFGSRNKVELVARYHSEPHSISARSPLFGRRSLLRV